MVPIANSLNYASKISFTLVGFNLMFSKNVPGGTSRLSPLNGHFSELKFSQTDCFPNLFQKIRSKKKMFGKTDWREKFSFGKICHRENVRSGKRLQDDDHESEKQI